MGGVLESTKCGVVDRVVLDGSPGGLVQQVVGSALVDIGSGDVPMGMLDLGLCRGRRKPRPGSIPSYLLRCSPEQSHARQREGR